MEDYLFPWSNFMVHLSWSDFFKSNLQSLWAPSPGVNRIWTKRNDHAPKSECASFFFSNICPMMAVLEKFKFDYSFAFSCFHLLFPKKVSLKICYNIITMPWALAFFLPKHLFCFFHRKTHWIMSMDNAGLPICLLGTSNSMVILTFFPWCKPTWSWDEFNIQSQILQGLGMTSWSMV